MIAREVFARGALAGSAAGRGGAGGARGGRHAGRGGAPRRRAVPGLIISLSLSLALALSLSLALSRSRSRSHSLAFSLSRSLYMKRETNLSLPGSEIHHTACSSLLLLKNSCGKLHCQKGFNSILFSYEVFIPGNMFCFSQSCNGNVYTTRSYQCYEKKCRHFRCHILYEQQISPD